MNLRNLLHLKKAKKSLVSAVALIALLGSVLIPVQSKEVQSADLATPRFNYLEGDAEMLRAAKVGTGSTWGDPVSANVGDQVAFLFYYHNGVLDSVAHNTTLRVELPTETSSQLKARSFLSSSETAPITDTVVNGQIVGNSGATINLATPGYLEYVPGSTKWYPNRANVGTSVADGITTTGLNIGNINGCWDYAGFVSFVTVVRGTPAQLVLEKLVAKPGESVWHNYIYANPGDSVAYRLGIRNDGGTTATNLSVRDVLPNYMTYETGTTYVYTKQNPAGVKLSDGITGNGISIQDVAPGQDGVIFISYRTKISGNIPTGSLTLVNTAKLLQSGTVKAQDQAEVILVAARGLVVDKTVSNGISWVEQNTAKLGDELDYRIVIRNTGNVPVTNVVVKDVLPVFTSYIAGSTKIDGIATNDGIATDAGLNIGTLNAGEEKVIVFKASTKGCPPVGGFTLMNTAYVNGDDCASEVYDSAITIINVTAPGAPLIN